VTKEVPLTRSQRKFWAVLRGDWQEIARLLPPREVADLVGSICQGRSNKEQTRITGEVIMILCDRRLSKQDRCRVTRTWLVDYGLGLEINHPGWDRFHRSHRHWIREQGDQGRLNSMMLW
jgi:hypothetical protein